jgi:hypothetical protein
LATSATPCQANTGKTAIVATLTGDPRAEVGGGFEPCTRTAAFYDLPPEVPLLGFFDTRGLGEADYDPEKDIARCEGRSHLLLAVMQVDDPVQETVLRVVREARRRHGLATRDAARRRNASCRPFHPFGQVV